MHLNLVYRAYRAPYDWVPQLEKPQERAIGRLDVTTFRGLTPLVRLAQARPRWPSGVLSIAGDCGRYGPPRALTGGPVSDELFLRLREGLRLLALLEER